MNCIALLQAASVMPGNRSSTPSSRKDSSSTSPRVSARNCRAALLQKRHSPSNRTVSRAGAVVVATAESLIARTARRSGQPRQSVSALLLLQLLVLGPILLGLL